MSCLVRPLQRHCLYTSLSVACFQAFLQPHLKDI